MSAHAEDSFDAEVCLIGAGPAGLAMGKALVDRAVDLDWFEKGSMVGGLWRIDNDNDGAAAYSTLHLNSSRPMTQYPSYPMPSDWPDYPSHALMADYFHAFAKDNGLLKRISFQSEVTSVAPLPGPGVTGENGWQVTTHHGSRTYRHVLVANGHHGSPKIPEFPGRFSGTTFHAHDYRDPTVFAGKDVLVIGVGNSGMDLACDAAKSARSVLVSTRHGVHVIPKYAFGVPVDQISNRFSAYIPFAVERRIMEAIIRVTTGHIEGRGMPKPDHRLFDAHPTVSAEFLDRVGHGDITVKPAVAELGDGTVTFVDGSVEPVEVMAYATGYRVRLPFLDPSLLDPTGNRMPLYQRVVPPDMAGLFFIGFIQAVGSGIAITEYQAEWVADVIIGRSTLPDRDHMRSWVEDDEVAMRRRYVRSERHTMQVDYWRYIRALKEERARRPDPSAWDRVAGRFAGLR